MKTREVFKETAACSRKKCNTINNLICKRYPTMALGCY